MRELRYLQIATPEAVSRLTWTQSIAIDVEIFRLTREGLSSKWLCLVKMSREAQDTEASPCNTIFVGRHFCYHLNE